MKRIFVSATTHDGNFGASASAALTAADALCNADANKPATGTYKAMIVNTARTACTTANCGGGISENVNWILSANTSYYRANGTTLIGTTNAAAIFPIPLTNAPHTAATIVYTGLYSNWTTDSSTCSNWTNNSGIFGVYGQANLTSDGFIIGGSILCSNSRAVYCVEQ